jgi:outer membrane protein
MLNKVKSAGLGFVMCGLGLALGSGSALAQKEKSLKIAFVDMQMAILKTEEGIQAKANIEKAAEAKKKELMNQQDDIKKLEEEFQKQMAILTDDVKMQKQKELQTKFMNWNNARQSFESEMRQKELEETKKILDNLSGILDGMAKKKGYDLVFEKGAGAVIYSSKTDDLTDDLVKEYNSKHKAKK